MSRCNNINYGLSITIIAYNLYAAYNNYQVLRVIGLRGAVFIGNLWQEPTIIGASSYIKTLIINIIMVLLGVISCACSYFGPLVLLQHCTEVYTSFRGLIITTRSFLSRLTTARIVFERERCVCGIYHAQDSACYGPSPSSVHIGEATVVHSTSELRSTTDELQSVTLTGVQSTWEDPGVPVPPKRLRRGEDTTNDEHQEIQKPCVPSQPPTVIGGLKVLCTFDV